VGRHFTAPQFLGLSCDTTACRAEIMAPEPLGPGSVEASEWLTEITAAGWAFEGASVRCPEHAGGGSNG
jgi:hypothetical protein